MRCQEKGCLAEAVIKGRCRRCYNKHYMRTYNAEGRNKWRKNNRLLLREYNNKSYKKRGRPSGYYKKNSVRILTRQLEQTLRKLGMTALDYEKKLQEQGGRCAICREEPATRRRLAVDHCHATGKFRGLLCNGCNLAIGCLRDDPSRARAAARYLKTSG